MQLDRPPTLEGAGGPSDRDGAITEQAVEAYLKAAVHPSARLLTLRPLGETSGAALKCYGYGRPLCATYDAQGRARHLVVRTMRPDPFGHDRRSDRIQTLALAFDTYSGIPKHVRAVDVGVFDSNGRMVSLPRGEPFLVTSYEEGELYASILERAAREKETPELEKDRARALAEYLALLHEERASPESYLRSVRDTVGSGEGIFGLSDSYPLSHPTITPERLEQLEISAVRWRWKLRAHAGRARRTHGDFHPFNLLFREGTDLTVLDASRGCKGEPADDVSCLAINYLFFALTSGRARFDGPMRGLWDIFWRTYLERTNDRELCGLVAPFFAWRALVLASPRWYPTIAEDVRDKLVGFAERLLEGARFSPDRVDEVLE